jgi:hypothetical protein
MNSRHLVRLKTPEELSESNWIMTTDGYFRYDGDNRDYKNPPITPDMYPLLGKIIIIINNDDGVFKYIYRDSEEKFYYISEGMISKYLDFEDYPEYLI